MAKVSSLQRVIPTATVRKYTSATKAIVRELASSIVLDSEEACIKAYRGGITKTRVLNP